MKNKNKFFLIMGIMIVLAGACGARPEPTPTVDPNEIMTQVAATIEAEITQNALLTPSPTATLPPTSTPPPITTPLPAIVPTLPVAAPQQLPAESPDNSKFIKDMTIKDGTVFSRNESFIKTWRIENIGTTTWDPSYYLVFLDSPDGTVLVDTTKLADPAKIMIAIEKPVKPEVQIDISVPMRAPDRTGTFKNWFRLMNDKGQYFGDWMYVEIVVGTAPQATATMAG